MDISKIILLGKGRLQQLVLIDKFKPSLNRDSYGYKNAFTKLKIISKSKPHTCREVTFLEKQTRK